MTNDTSLHVRRARQGDAASREWIVQRFHPILVAQARLRLAQVGVDECDPEDLVHEAWAAALPRLPELAERAGRETPVLLKFLATTLLHHVNNLARRKLRRGTAAGDTALEGVPAVQRRALSEAVSREAVAAVERALDALDPRDREVVLLRGIEQLPNADAAALLGESENAVSLRYNRALEKLRRALPLSIFAEID
jgi:RNA polymerase sigma-70 factor (ECF subfamily)